MKRMKKEFNTLNANEKKAINAYISGREFMTIAKSTIALEEISGKVYPTIVASIVNKALACELFLKSLYIIKYNKCVNGHDLFNLYSKLGNKIIEKKLPNYNFIAELKKVRNSFVDWRYSYECDNLIVNMKFLTELCSVLEKINRSNISKQYNIDL
jgi:hypothetical protein